jgi:hypothetical protein
VPVMTVVPPGPFSMSSPAYSTPQVSPYSTRLTSVM